jgi:hypothetical protein
VQEIKISKTQNQNHSQESSSESEEDDDESMSEKEDAESEIHQEDDDEEMDAIDCSDSPSVLSVSKETPMKCGILVSVERQPTINLAEYLKK